MRSSESMFDATLAFVRNPDTTICKSILFPCEDSVLRKQQPSKDLSP